MRGSSDLVREGEVEGTEDFGMVDPGPKGLNT